MNNKKRIVVVGGGFAGVSFVKEIDTNLFDVTLIDKINHHQFQPLFYQVATSKIEPSSITFPLRYIFRTKKKLNIRLAEVTNIDINGNTINTSVGDFEYDYLVLAMGCKTNFFGNKEISKYALTLKTTLDAINIRNHVLQNFENIINCSDDDQRDELLNIIIVGAGATGVELAGSFAEIKNNILPKDFYNIDFSKLRIILIEGSPYTLVNMSERSRYTSKRNLEQMGVEILTNTNVISYDGKILKTSTGEVIKSKTVIWAAGVTANTVSGIPQEVFEKGNRLRVNRINKLEQSENIYVLGDIAYMETPKYPLAHPQLANIAINQGRNLARNLKNIARGKATKDYVYKNKGTMATIGRNKAVVDLSFLTIKGYIAWLIWMFLHLILILNIRNKFIIFINWSWAYITKNTALRIILKENNDNK